MERRRKVEDVEIQNNNNIVDDSKTSKNHVLTKDLCKIKKPKQRQGMKENRAKKSSLEPTETGTFSGKLQRVLLAFSALNNGKKILQVNSISRDSIRCIHGLRFCSIIWIILVHTYLEVFSIADNKTLRIVTERSFMYQTISNATFSVDTFFFIRFILAAAIALPALTRFCFQWAVSDDHVFPHFNQTKP